jgi:hypothetical protein
VSFYLDANILVALLTPEALSERAIEFVQGAADRLIVSDFRGSRICFGDLTTGAHPADFYGRGTQRSYRL